MEKVLKEMLAELKRIRELLEPESRAVTVKIDGEKIAQAITGALEDAFIPKVDSESPRQL